MPEKKQNKKIVLLDVHAIIHRAYHALPDFASTKGEPTGAIYGLCTMLLKIVADLSPDFIVACYDLPEKTHRHEAYEAYKATRKKIDDALVAQIVRSNDVFKAFSIPSYSFAGFEADDVLGTIVETLKHDKSTDIVIASGDMDTMQLVDDKKVRVYTLRKGIKDTVIYDEDAVVERFGFVPTLLPDYKGLRGDPSDNIIGIAGIGEKTATILIQKFGTLEKMYKVLKKDQAPFREAGITPRIIDLLLKGEEEALFSKTLATIRRDAPIDFKMPEKTWKEAVDIKAVETLFAELEFKALLSRVENALGIKKMPLQASLLGGDGEEGNGSADAQKEVLPESEMKKLSLALWIIDSNITSPSIEDVLRFAHTESLLRARDFIMSELEKRNLMKVFREIEEPLMRVIEAMEKRGIKIDAKYLRQLSKQYHADLAELEKNIWREAGEEFNINSPKQLGVILFDKLGLSVKGLKKTAGGERSTRESELEKMEGLHPIIDYILKYRVLQKLLSTYIDTLPTLLAEDGRLHTTFLQTGTTTGRMSSNNPNIQNIPIKTDAGKKIRDAFVAEKGFKLVKFDYSQIELRIAALLSGDEKLIEIFKSGGDIHQAVASEVFKVPREKVDREMRRKAKVINFGILYGMGVNALKKNLDSTREEAQFFYDEYFKNFSGLASYLESVKASAKKLGYTETFFGRRRYFPNIKSKLPYIAAANERMAINAPIQGTSADIIKIAMVRIHEYIERAGLSKDVFLLLQVHDELVFEIKEEVVAKVTPELERIMQEVLKPEEMLGIPLVVNGEVGDNWGQTEAL
ncbi:MAG: DNA polymerase [Candidatus Paceibacterota bacterium]